MREHVGTMMYRSKLCVPTEAFGVVYHDLLGRIVRGGLGNSSLELNERTGRNIRMLNYGASFTLEFDQDRPTLPILGSRRLYPKTAAAELAWFLNGDRDLDWISRHCGIWDKFAEGGVVLAAYGWRMRSHFGRDQISLAIKALRDNPSDRRVWISMWDPSQDGLGVPAVNVPCPVGFGLSITDNRLNSTYVLRSSDVVVGLPYDVMNQSFMMNSIAAELGTRMGHLQVSIAHPHVYATHFDVVDTMLDGHNYMLEGPQMPWWDTNTILSDRDGYLKHVQDLSAKVPWSDYNPKPEVVL